MFAGGADAHAAHQRGAEVGQDVSEHVLGHHHVELPRGAHQAQGRGIDGMQSAVMSGWRAAMSRKMLRKNAIDGRTLALSTHVTRPALPAVSLPGQAEGEVAEPLGDAAADAQRIEDHVRTIAAAHSAQANRPWSTRGSGRSRCRPPAHRTGASASGEHADRPDAGEQLEAVAKIEVRRHLGAVRIPHVGQPHRAEQDGIAVSAPCSAAGGSASPVRRVQLSAGFEEGEVERDAADPLMTASSSATHGCMTSRPMPSPGKTAM